MREVRSHRAGDAGQEHLRVGRRLRGVRDLRPHRLAGEFERGLADLLLAAREVEVERAPGRAGGGQDIVQGGAVKTLAAEQQGRSGQRFLFGISSFCHA